MSRLWWISPYENVMRGDEIVAKISCVDGLYRWDGMGTYRAGFATKDAILEDVKYFYRYPAKRLTTITFKSGRKIIL